MIIKAEGIIFRSIKYSETSLIVDIFTREHGILSFIISGVRKKKSTISAAMLQVMNIVDIVAYTKNNQSLGRITEIKNNYVHKDLLYDFIKSAIGIFLIELSRNCIKEKEANINVYDFIKEYLINIDNKEEQLGLAPIIYMIQFSKHLGFYPHDNYSDKFNLFDWRAGIFVAEARTTTIDQVSSLYFNKLIKFSSDTNLDINIPKDERQIIMKSLLNYYQYHIESFKPLKSYDILEELMK